MAINEIRRISGLQTYIDGLQHPELNIPKFFNDVRFFILPLILPRSYLIKKIGVYGKEKSWCQ